MAILRPQQFPKYFEEEHISKKADTLSKDKFLKNLSKMADVKSIILKIKIKFDNIANHPWFGLTEEKNNPYELKDLRKIISKLNEESKVVREKIKSYFISLNLKLELDEYNVKNISNIFTKARDTDNKQIKDNIRHFDSIKKIEDLKKFKIDLEKFNEFLTIKKQLAKEVDYQR